jgi:hypothetical protein
MVILLREALPVINSLLNLLLPFGMSCSIQFLLSFAAIEKLEAGRQTSACFDVLNHLPLHRLWQWLTALSRSSNP